MKDPTAREPAADRLAALVFAKGPTCLGFDPRPEWAPPELRPKSSSIEHAAEAAVAYFDEVLEAASFAAAAVKIQAAFFERWLAPGFAAFVRCCRRARELGMFVVADVKRGDIGTTSEAYAEAYLSPVDGESPLADAVTVSPYLGSDGLNPFFAAARRHDGLVFTLVKTSNPSSKELQDLVVAGTTIAERVAAAVEAEAERTRAHFGYGSSGAVVGATHREELAHFRAAMPHAWLLLPGYGAQGAGPQDVVDAFDRRGLGALVAASRSLTYPWAGAGAPDAWRAALKTAARKMADELAALKPSAST
jgi:orotidine-5'-phosphate decarboxylase